VNTNFTSTEAVTQKELELVEKAKHVCALMSGTSDDISDSLIDVFGLQVKINKGFN
jgi:hypothetical protein